MPVSEVESVYCIIAGDELDANDFRCYLIVFLHEMWLLPEDTAGITALRQLRSFAEIEEKVKVVNVVFLPYTWRATWRILPGVSPNLKIIPKTELGSFKERAIELSGYDRGNLFLL